MYKVQSEHVILRIPDGAFIPCDERNADYQNYLLWLAEGNTPEPADSQTTIIPPITTRQFLIAAMGAGFISAEEAIAASTSGAVPASIAASFAELSLAEQVAAQITWAKMTVIGRHEPLVIAAAAQLGLNDEQVDAFFLQAATI